MVRSNKSTEAKTHGISQYAASVISVALAATHIIPPAPAILEIAPTPNYRSADVYRAGADSKSGPRRGEK